MKRNILRRLAASGIEATVFPAKTPPAEIAGGGFDGVFLSNGPGDPAATAYGVAAARDAARQGTGLRHLPGAPAARPRPRRPHLQDEVRSPGREPAGEEPADRASSRSRATTTASRSIPRRGRARRRAGSRAPIAVGSRSRTGTSTTARSRACAASTCRRSACSTTPRPRPDRTTRATCSTDFRALMGERARSGRPDAAAQRHPQDHGDRLGADRDRAGVRVRLLRHAGVQGAPRAKGSRSRS